MSWINDFTVAIVEENPMKIGELIEEMPQFTDISEARSAQALIQEALVLLRVEREKVFSAMQKLKKTRAFITTTSSETHQREYRG